MADPRIRNFAIIAHVDHGKSTLADRFLEVTGALTDREMRDQFLDKMELERERGITIKAQSVRLLYQARDGQIHPLNLIDTPGHVDFSYEVSRSLAACEGAILVVDAVQGVEAQTLANVYLALENDLEIIPVINKIDLPGAQPDEIRRQIEEVIGLDCTHIVHCSAKTGTGVEGVLQAVIDHIPAPSGSEEAPLKALLFDSWFDSYQGVIALVRVFEGVIEKGMRIRMMATGSVHEVLKLGVQAPHPVEVPRLKAGEVGFVIAGLKDIHQTRVGDTLTEDKRPTATALPGFRESKPMVFSGIFPVDPSEYPDLREALEKLQLNDASFTWEPETSEALGFGFRCGFLGLLHMEIIQERLEREYDLELITTAPNVVYRAVMKDGTEMVVHKPSDLPDPGRFDELKEPYVRAAIHCPAEHVGSIMALCTDRRGRQVSMEYLSTQKVVLTYDLPFGEVLFDFHDKLKSATRGYASMDYEFREFEVGDLVKLDILVNGEPVDALSIIVHRDKAYNRGQDVCRTIRDHIPRQQFEVAVQASIGTRVIARTTQKALRKNVTAKCYGGDISRKRKLLERQKEGKKRMKQVGNVEIPQEAFLAVLKVEN